MPGSARLQGGLQGCGNHHRLRHWQQSPAARPGLSHFTDAETEGGATAKAGSSGLLETSGATGEKEERKEGKFNTYLAPLGTRHPAGLFDVESIVILTPEDSTIVMPILEMVKLSIQEER